MRREESVGRYAGMVVAVASQYNTVEAENAASGAVIFFFQFRAEFWVRKCFVPGNGTSLPEPFCRRLVVLCRQSFEFLSL